MKNYEIGANPEIGKNVILGHKTDRNIKIEKLIVGKNACIRSNSVIYTNTKIGDFLETGHNVVIREENSIGNEFKVWNNSVIDYGCIIGNNVRIHSNVYIAQYTKIEDDVFLAPGVMITNDFHPGCDYSKKCMQGPTIKEGTQIGANVTILPKVKIGKCSLVGAGSVVTSDIPDYMLAYGNPAKVIKSVKDIKCRSGLTDYPYR